MPPIDVLKKAQEVLSRKKVVAGFDAFIDMIARPVKCSEANGSPVLYGKMEELGQFILDRAGKSGTLQLVKCEERLGGNAPNFGSAISSMGAATTCIGSFGLQQTAAPFIGLAQSCSLVSIGEPAQCIALEFGDGKLMLGMNEALDEIDWKLLCARVGRDKLEALYTQCDLAAFLNWSEVAQATGLWQGFLNDVEPLLPQGKWMLFDLSDTAARKSSELQEALQVLAGFGKRHKTVLSLNENEYTGVCIALGLAKEDFLDTGKVICEKLGLHSLFLHFMGYAHCVCGGESYTIPTVSIEQPAITTGAGDHFNAGVSVGLLLGMPPQDAMVCGMMTSSYYVCYGKGPTLEELRVFMEENQRMATA